MGHRDRPGRVRPRAAVPDGVAGRGRGEREHGPDAGGRRNRSNASDHAPVAGDHADRIVEAVVAAQLQLGRVLVGAPRERADRSHRGTDHPDVRDDVRDDRERGRSIEGCQAEGVGGIARDRERLGRGSHGAGDRGGCAAAGAVHDADRIAGQERGAGRRADVNLEGLARNPHAVDRGRARDLDVPCRAGITDLRRRPAGREVERNHAA